MALLAVRRPAAFAARREALVVALKLHVLLMTIDGGACGDGACSRQRSCHWLVAMRAVRPLTPSHMPAINNGAAPSRLATAALNGGTNILEWHHGSPVLLLALLLVFNGGLWLCIFSLIGDLPLALNAAALPLLAAVPVSSRAHRPLPACAPRVCSAEVQAYRSALAAEATNRPALTACPWIPRLQALASPALCRRLLEAPGAAEPLALLYSAMGVLQ